MNTCNLTSHAEATIPLVAAPGVLPARILVVEDDATVRLTHQLALTQCGYQVDVVVDGEAAWAALQTTRYDLMVTDNTMPRLAGLELVKRIRAAHLSLPVILASGLIDQKSLAKQPWLKLAATLQKPFTYKELVSVVKQALHPAAGAQHPR